MFALSRFGNSDERLEYARELLRDSAHLEPTRAKPIAAFLCLIELLAWLAGHPLPDDGNKHRSSHDHGEQQRAGDEESTDGTAQVPRTGGADVTDGAAGAVNAATGSIAQGRAAGSEDDNAPADWAAWKEYLGELYVRPSEVDEQGGATADANTAPSPLFLPSASITHLRLALSRPIFDLVTRSLLLSGCASSLLVSLSTDKQSPDSLPDFALEMLMTEARSPTFPTPLPFHTVSTIALSLGATRRKGPAAEQRNRVSRETLTTLLGHYVSPVSFRKFSHEADGRMEYAATPEDNALVLSAFPAPPTTAVLHASDVEDDEDDQADTRSVATGIRDAHASITRKDDKLRWLLGDNFQPGTSPPSAKASRSPPPFERMREMSSDSFASMSTVVTADGTGSTMRHQRFTSTSSSIAPLLDQPSPRTSPSPTRPSFLHRRVMSTSTALIRAPHPLAVPPEQPQRPTGDVVFGNVQPFADLAPAVPHVATPSSTLAPLAPHAPVSPRRTSLDSSLDARQSRPMNCNNLSVEQRRELVRRSKKLEDFFGAPFQEEAAARVLVDGRGAGQDDEVSPTSGAFPPVARSSAAGSSSDLSTGSSSHRASLAPPLPTQGYTFGSHPSLATSRFDARRPSLLSLSSSQGSTSHSARGSNSSLAPVSPRSPRMQRSSSSPSRGRRSSSFSSLAEPAHTYFSERMERDRAEARARDAREERRRKLDKVSRVLGERVPLALVVPGSSSSSDGEPGAAGFTGGATVGRSRSRGAGGMGALRDRLKRGNAAPGPAPEPAAGGGDAGWRYVEPRWEESARPEEGGDGRRGRQGVEALHRARKLENLFGDLPPPALFLPQASTSPISPVTASRPPLATRHRRSFSDLSGLAHSPFSPYATAGAWHPSTSAALHHESTRCTVDSYRQSIASLKYVMERDPGALDEVVRVYSAAQRDAEDAFAASSAGATDDEADGEGEGEAPTMERSASASSHRAVRKAQKLSNFFGTTHGEVWRLLLDDIEASIVDDDALDEEERLEVLANLDRLRQSASTRL